MNVTVASMTSVADDDVSVILCDPCCSDGNDVIGYGYCKDCREYLCEGCFTVHCRPSVTRHHVLLDKTSMPRDVKSQNAVKDVCTEQCVKHERKILEYFCRTHEELGCSVCMTTQHRTCANVDYIPDVVGENDFETDLTELQKHVESLHGTVTAGESKVSSLELAISVNEKMAVSKIKDVRKGLKVYFDDLEKRALKEVKDLKESDDGNVAKVRSQLKDALNLLVSLRADVNIKKESRQYCKLFVMMKRNRSDVKKYKEDLEDILSKNIIRRYEFLANSKLAAFKDQIKELGELIIKESSVKIAACAESLNVKSDGDQGTSNISGLTLLTENVLVAVDNMNKAVKIVDITENTLKGQYNCESDPWDVTRINDNKVAVTLPNLTSIEILDVQTDGIVARNEIMDIERNCYGIAYSHDHLYVTFNNPGSVNVLNMKGEIQHTFAQKFGVPWYVALSVDARSIYVTDTGQNTVTLLDNDGNVKAIFKDDNLKGLRGIATDRTGSVYACGWGSNNVIQMTSYCVKEQTLQDGKLRLSRPYSVQYCDASDRLFIGMSCDQIRVIQFH